MTNITLRTAAPRFSALLAVAALTALSACGSTGDDDTGSSPSTAAADSTSYPLTLETPFGDTTLEEKPERIAIVTASTIDTDATFALGVTPVFAPSTVERNPWLTEEQISGVETLWQSEAGASVSFEEVAASEPDLVVSLAAADTFDQQYFDEISKIAPVLYAPYGDLSWQELTTSLGETLDLTEEANTVVADAESSIEATKEAHPEFVGKTAAHVIVYPEEYGASYASAPGSDTAELFQTLGFELPEAAEQFTENETISLENADLIDADFLLLSTMGDNPEYFTEAGTVRQVPAVAEGRAVINPADEESGVNYLGWGLDKQSALSTPWLVDQLADFADQALN